MTASVDLVTTRRHLLRTSRTFRGSLFIRHVDAGSDGAVESEILALSNPYYDLNRLGFFFTASPRHADVLLVSGGVTSEMVDPLRAAFELMPKPRAVIAAGTAACGGGIEGEGRTAGGVDRAIPVDVYCPGDPPTPLMLLHALLVAVGRVGRRPNMERDRR